MVTINRNEFFSMNSPALHSILVAEVQAGASVDIHRNPTFMCMKPREERVLLNSARSAGYHVTEPSINLIAENFSRSNAHSFQKSPACLLGGGAMMLELVELSSR